VPAAPVHRAGGTGRLSGGWRDSGPAGEPCHGRQDVVFRAARGSKLSAAEGQELAAFEADDYDEQAQSGWSVLVSGRAEAVYAEAEIQRLSRLGLQPWATGAQRPFWIRIRSSSVTGRQIR